MSRVKRGTTANKKRKKVLKATKGFRWDRKTKERAAKEALLHAYTHAFRGRKEKKRVYRQLWQVQLNAALRTREMNYRDFIHGLKTHNVELDRKVLAEIAQKYPTVFDAIVTMVKA